MMRPTMIMMVGITSATRESIEVDRDMVKEQLNRNNKVSKGELVTDFPLWHRLWRDPYLAQMAINISLVLLKANKKITALDGIFRW